MKLIISATIGLFMMLWSIAMGWWSFVALWAVLLFLTNYHHIRRIFVGKGGIDEPDQDG